LKSEKEVVKFKDTLQELIRELEEIDPMLNLRALKGALQTLHWVLMPSEEGTDETI